MKKLYFPAVIFLVFLLNSCMHSKKSVTTSLQFAPNIVVAHRGAWKKKNLPENSIASLQEAVRLGCTGSEFDVHLTADDSLIVNHDAHYAGLPVEKSTYAELAATKLSNGEMLPTVSSYLKEGMKQTNTALVLEIKPSAISKERGQYLAEKVVSLVKQLKAEPWIMYISFDYDILQKVLELQPGAKTAYLNGEKSPEQLKAGHIWGADYHYNVFKNNESWIADAQKNGVNLNVWTVNKAEDMEWFLNRKFDYITTNEPEMLFEIIHKHGSN